MRNELLIIKKYLILKGCASHIRYLLIEENNTYGIKIIYEGEENEVVLKNQTRDDVVLLIKILSDGLTFPIELPYILEELFFNV